MIDLAILGLLKDNELHGYELKKRLRELLGPLSSVSFGSLYPALARLEQQGAVKAVEALGSSAPPMPMTGSIGGELAAFKSARRRVTSGVRGKKVYGITDVGERRLAELMEQPGDDDRSFTLRLAFSRHLAAEARLGLLERRRAQLVERLADARAVLARADGRLDTYTRSLREHDAESTEHDIAWIDRLMAAERGRARIDTGGTHP